MVMQRRGSIRQLRMRGLIVRRNSLTRGAFTVEATAFNAEGVVDINMLNESFEKIRDYLNN